MPAATMSGRGGKPVRVLIDLGLSTRAALGALFVAIPYPPISPSE